MADADYDMKPTKEQELEVEMQKTKLFRASIAVCIAYGGVAFAFFIAIIASERARALLADTLAAFTVTFVIGTLLVMTWLAIVVKRFKPTPPSARRDRDMLKCPDYFILQRTPASEISPASENIKHLLSYRCVPDPNVYDVSKFVGPTYRADWTPGLYEGAYNQLNQAGIQCSNIYPQFMYKLDTLSNIDMPNRYRCEFLKACSNHFTWSSVCPNGPYE